MLLNVLRNKFPTSILIGVAGCLWLTACTTPIQEPVVDQNNHGLQQAWKKRQHRLTAIRSWHLTGRMAVSQGEDAWNLNLDWQQRDQDYEILLHGPFGVGKVRLVGNDYGVVLRDSDDQTFYADKAETLLYEQTGIRMPLQDLRYWILGLTGPREQQQTRLDTEGRLASLEDADWQVNFRRYRAVDGIELPQKVFIIKPQNQLDVRLVIDNWQLGQF